MRRSRSIRLGLAGTRKVFRLVSELRTLRDRPELQRRRLCEGVRELIGMPGQPGPGLEWFTARQWGAFVEQVVGHSARRRSVRWFSQWAAGDGADDGHSQGVVRGNGAAKLHVPADFATRPGSDLMLRLLITELYRRHRDGSLDGQAMTPQLTPRQSEVLEHLLAGRTAVQIGDALGVSRRTVEEHVRAIYARFDVTTRAELMAAFIDETMGSARLS